MLVLRLKPGHGFILDQDTRIILLESSFTKVRIGVISRPGTTPVEVIRDVHYLEKFGIDPDLKLDSAIHKEFARSYGHPIPTLPGDDPQTSNRCEKLPLPPP